MLRAKPRRWRSERFENNSEDPTASMANLLDLMLVFACGLIAALIAMSDQLQQRFQSQPNQQVIERGQELPQLPLQGENGTDGYEAVGQVYRDPETGRLILIGD